MNIPVRSRCHRILRHTKNYHTLLPDYEYYDPEYEQKEYPIHLDADEELVGVYENIPGEDIARHNVSSNEIRDNIVITNKGLHLCSSKKSEKIYFKDIIRVYGPENKINDLTLHIRLKNNKTINIPILYTGIGEYGYYKDYCLFLSFLKNMASDQRESSD